MTKAVVIVRFVVRAGHETLFLTRVTQQAAASLDNEPLCLRFDVCSDAADPRRVCMFEVYETPEAFRAPLATKHFRDFDRDTREWIEENVVETWVLQPPGPRPAEWLAQ